MAEGFSVATAQAILAAMLQQTSFVYSNVWAKLHIGAPGAAGTANPAAETTRVDVTSCFGASPDSSVSIANDADMGPWTSVTASEDYTHITLWTASTSGTFICSGVITAAAVTAGSSFTIPAGDCTLSIPVAA